MPYSAPQLRRYDVHHDRSTGVGHKQDDRNLSEIELEVCEREEFLETVTVRAVASAVVVETSDRADRREVHRL